MLYFPEKPSCDLAFLPTQLRLSPQANRPPAKLNLLTCQVKTNPEEKKCFDLISRELFLRRSAAERLL